MASIPGSLRKSGVLARLLESEFNITNVDKMSAAELTAALANLAVHLHEQNDEKLIQIDAALRGHEDYKLLVGRRAMAAAIQHGWCDEVKEVLKDLDVYLDDVPFDAKVTVTYELTGKIPYDHLKSFQDSPRTFLMQHLSVPAAILAEGEKKTLTLGEAEVHFDPAEIDIEPASPALDVTNVDPEF